jgi:SOS-response transcriptional repressor LexA
MTRKQAQLLDFIRHYMSTNGHSPSLEDMAAALGGKSKGNVSRYLVRLQRAGLVEWRKNVARSVRLVDMCGDDVATIESDLMAAELKRRGFTIVAPLAQAVVA